MSGIEESEQPFIPNHYQGFKEQDDDLLSWVLVSAIITMIILLAVFWPGTSHAEEFEPVMISDAIFHAEGGARAQYLYGIRSVHYEDFKEARKICIRTIRHSRKRWEKAGRPGDFLQFLSQSYCPVGASNDPRGLNKNWERNVRFWLAKGAH
jgi:hypothetical protein